MATFQYKARNQAGDVVNGTLVADSTVAAARMLDERRLMPVDVAEVRQDGRSFFTGRSRRVSPTKVGVVYEQLADLLNAGVPLLRSLDVLARQSADATLAHVLREVHEDVAGGDPLADAMERHPRVFQHLHAAMIRAGEKGGFLEEVLARLSEFVARQDELRNRFLGALAYPTILAIVMVGAVAVIMSFVVPKIRPMIEDTGQQLPVVTQMLFGLTDMLTQYYLAVGGILLVVFLVVFGFVQSQAGKRLWSLAQLKLWGIGRIYTMISLCRFCRILGTLLANGIPIITALEIAKDSAGNAILAEAIHDAAENVRRGEALTQPLAESKLFPPAIIDMIAVAEESNTLDKTLIDVANTQEARTGRQIDLFMRLLEPLLLLVAATMVLFIAVALLVPILTSATSGLK